MIPPKQNAEFVANMEDVLEQYCLPYNPDIPLVNMDEQPVQMVKETRQPLPIKPGFQECFDFEYERNGMANVFMFSEALAGKRKVNIRERKTSLDWAYEIKQLLDVDYPQVKKVRLICDNLNTHKISSLYKAFEPKEALRLAKRLEIHYTPKHGSWLNIAEIELSVMTKQCLDHRIPDIETLRQQTKAWEQERNTSQKGVDWRFTTADARIKLKHLYPQIQLS